MRAPPGLPAGVAVVLAVGALALRLLLAPPVFAGHTATIVDTIVDSSPAPLTEANLNGAVVHVRVDGATLINSLSTLHITLFPGPEGASIGKIDREEGNNTDFWATIVFSPSQPFESDQSLRIRIGSTQFQTGGHGVSATTQAVTVFRVVPLSTDASLSALTLSAGQLDPAFDAETTAYAAEVANDVESIEVTATVAHEEATLSIAGEEATSGEAVSVALAVGANAIEVVVTAEDGETARTYTITVTRAASTDASLAALVLSPGTLDPEFDAETADYAAEVPAGTASLDVTATLGHAGASLVIGGSSATSGVAKAVSLAVGTNEVTVVVTAEDGTTARTYTVIVTRPAATDASLANLVLSAGTLDPEFDAAETEYAVAVPNSVESIDVTATLADPNAALEIGGEAAVSGVATSVPLDVGPNEIAILVTAEDGTSVRTYTLAAARAPPDTTPPVLSVPPDVVIEVPEGAPLPALSHASIAALLAGASAEDDVDGARPVTHDAPAVFPFCTTTITFSAGDSAGNVGQAAATVTVLPAPAAIDDAVSLLDDRFEADAGSWAAESGALTSDAAAGVCEGSASARHTLGGAGAHRLESKYWLTATGPGAEHALALLAARNDDSIEDVVVRLEFVDGAGNLLSVGSIAPLTAGTGYQAVYISATAHHASTAFARVVVTVDATAGGGSISLDAVRLIRGPIPPPPPAAPPAEPPPPPPAPPSAPLLSGALFNGDFEAEPALLGWSAVGGALSLRPFAAGRAAVLASHSQSTKWIEQLVLVDPGGWYEARALLVPDGGVEAAWVRIAWYASTAGGGSQLSTRDSPLVAGGGADFVSTGSVQAPSNAHSARVRILLRPLGNAPAELLIDDVALAPAAPAPPSPPAPPPGAAGAPPRAPAGSTSGVPPVLFGALFNGDFSEGDGLAGWRKQGGEVLVRDRADGGGREAVLVSTTTSTKWIEQLVLVEPDGWYEANALLAPGEGVDAAWVRIAWYATLDGSGRQLATADSPVLGAASAAVQELRAAERASAFLLLTVVDDAEEVSTGPVQAPPGAQSARVRIMLRPQSAARAELAVRGASFGAAVPPPPRAETPAAPPGTPPAVAAPAPAATPAAPAVPRPRDGAPASSPGGAPAPPPDAARDEAPIPAFALRLPRELLAAAQALLRITEVFPDSEESGVDRDYEWVEVTNLGATAAPLAGLVLRDNAGEVALPDLVLPPGASIVVAGPLARVGAAFAYHLPGGISNGLGNQGDRLELLAADGSRLDALSYGTDATFRDASHPLPAPGPGRSIERRFDAAGRLVAVAILDVPTPGSAVVAGAAALPTAGGEPADAEPAADAPTAVRSVGTDRLAWGAAFAIAFGWLWRELRARRPWPRLRA